MTDIVDGFYADPLDPSVMREWSRGRWTAYVVPGPDEARETRQGPHVMKSLPRPGDSSVVVINATEPHSRASESARPTGGMVIAIVWAVVAFIAGLVFIFTTQDISYGGDAYSGIQQTGAQTVRALGFLIIGSGALGLVIARR